MDAHAVPISHLYSLLSMCYYSILDLNYEWFFSFSHLSLSNLASTHHHPVDVVLAKFTSDQHMARFNTFQTSFCLTSKQFSAQLLLPFFLWRCLSWIGFYWIPWHWVLMILFPYFCLHLSFLCWLLCPLLTSTCWSPSDLNLGSSFLFILSCVIKAILPTLVWFYGPRASQDIALSPSAPFWPQNLYFQFLCDMPAWIQRLNCTLQVKSLYYLPLSQATWFSVLRTGGWWKSSTVGRQLAALLILRVNNNDFERK